MWRKIEMRADQTLANLHTAIQDAYVWGGGHLYSFFMSNRVWDRTSEYCLPEDVDPWDDTPPPEEETKEKSDIPPEMEALLRELLFGVPNVVEVARRRLGDQFDKLAAHFAEPGDARLAKLESLDLEVGKKFMYLYDYGDEWRFRVRVHAINENAPDDAEYPRIVESVGEGPM
jgi:hypothetical protein